MKKGLLRDLLTVLFFCLTVAGPVLFGLCGFLFTIWYIANIGLDGLQEAFRQQDYFQMVKHAIPLLFIKTFALGAGVIGLALGWLPGYLGLLFLERNDEPVSPEAFYLPARRKSGGRG